MNCPTRDPEPKGNPTFNQNPPVFDRALVPRSSPICGGIGLREEEYNMGLHIMALFVILTQSSLACAFPLIAKRFPRLRIPPSFLFFARHFGTGVLIATAFVHLLPTAFISLTNPCLPAFWNDQYPAMAGAIAMAAVFLVTIVEMVFTKGLCAGTYSPEDHLAATLEAGAPTVIVAGPGGRGELDDDDEEEGEKQMKKGKKTQDSDALSDHIGGIGGMGRLGFGMAGRRRSRSHSVGQGLQKFSTEMSARRAGDAITVIVDEDESSARSRRSSLSMKGAVATTEEQQHQANGHGNGHGHGHQKLQLTPQQRHKKAMLQVFLLELGILFHSVFIGMALSVTVGSGFIVLLIAIIFHQTFEGLALGSRIAALQWTEGTWQPWVMACAYGLTTPIGQAIGLGTHRLYSPASPTGLMMVGIMNAISSGLLVFAGLVELLAEDFLSDESWHTLKGRKRIVACCWVFAGAFGMSLVGGWA